MMEKLNIAIEEWELYNNGILLCSWFDCDSDIEEINRFVSKVKFEHGLNGNDLELFIADSENDIFDIVNESSCIEDVFNTYNELDFDEEQLEILEYLTNYLNYDLKEATDKLEDIEIYGCGSLIELAEQFVDEGLFGEIPDSIANYLDYESMGRDLGFDGYEGYGGRIYRV